MIENPDDPIFLLKVLPNNRPVDRPIRIITGLFSGFAGLVLLFFVIFVLHEGFQSWEKFTSGKIVNAFFVVLFLLCCSAFLFQTSWRLLSNKKRIDGGLFSPMILRFVGIFCCPWGGYLCLNNNVNLGFMMFIMTIYCLKKANRQQENINK